MANQVPLNNGLDWPTVPTDAELPNVSGAAIQSEDLTPGARCFVSGVGTYTCSVPTPGAATWALTGSLSGGGGGAAVVGPFNCTTAVGLVLASYATGVWVAPRAGSITGISGWVSTPAADDDLVADVYVGVTPAGQALTFSDGGDQVEYLTITAGTIAVAAGDSVFIGITGGASLSNTPLFVGSVEFTPS